MGCNVSRESSPPPAHRAQEAQTGTAGDSTTRRDAARQPLQAIDPPLSPLQRPQEHPTNNSVSRAAQGLFRPVGAQEDDAESMASIDSILSTNREVRPIGDVLNRRVLNSLFSAENASSSITLDGGRVAVSYDRDYRTIRANFGGRYGPVNFVLDEQGQGVKSIGGWPSPTSADLQYLANVGLLQPAVVDRLDPPPVGISEAAFGFPDEIPSIGSAQYQIAFNSLTEFHSSFPDGSVEAIKEVIAAQVMHDLDLLEIDLDGKEVLDVGSGLGFNAKAMKENGASVYGVEPDPDAAAKSISHSNFDKERLFVGKLQEMPNHMKGKFDLATVFLWNIPHAQRDDVMKGLCAALKPGGKVIIGLNDQVYIDDPFGVAVRPLAERYFSNVSATFVNDAHQNRQLLICSSARPQ